MITQKQIAEWRELKDEGMVSGVGEYTPPELWEALDEIERLKRNVSKYHRLYQQASGRAARYARSRNYHVQDKHLYRRKLDAVLAVMPNSVNMHIAPDWIVALRHQKNDLQNRYNDLLILLERLKKDMTYFRGKSMSIEEVQEMVLDFADSRIANTNYFSEIDRRNDIIEFIEEWRRNNDC